ncbi:FAD/FMN-containing dehydrogenase [Apiospora aurea]|uniref:FAD/FMN-containing dehydrogenase n=1 Tax=Apiospora aurea TaxID=335848 RepID=A0ABR1QPL8_9PEZI
MKLSHVGEALPVIGTRYSWVSTILLITAIFAASIAAAASTASGTIWTSLNTTLTGLLRQSEPLSRQCFHNFAGQPVAVDEAACAAVRSNYTTNLFRDARPAGYMNPQSEMCLSDPADQCILDTANTTAPPCLPSPSAACGRGAVPAYYVEVQSASDVVAALDFARAHRDSDGVYLVVKNSGHDYMTRNNGGPGGNALMLWMHRLKGMDFHESFVPDGCSSAEAKGMRAMTVAAGESTGDAFAFAAVYDSLVLGGYSPTIALSGGWILGGGHGPLAPVYGLGADRILQMRVVTPDGMERVVAACNEHAELFRALRGGGVGGAFGVVLEATHRLEPGPLPIAVASLRLPDDAPTETVLEWIELQARSSLRWGREGWGGHVAGLYLTHFNPLPAIANLRDTAAATASMREASDFVLAHGGTSIVEVLADYLAAWNKYVVPGATKTAGNARFISSRLIPKDMFTDEAGIQRIMGFLKSLPTDRWNPRNLYVPAATPFVAHTNKTYGRPLSSAVGTSAVHPAWYTSLWSLSTGFTLPWNATYGERLDTFTWFTELTQQQEGLTGEKGGSYVNEANLFTQDWREAWWGSREDYERLVETKRKYDPDGLMNCWKCVGFEDEDLVGERFRCQGKLQIAIDESLAQNGSK